MRKGALAHAVGGARRSREPQAKIDDLDAAAGPCSASVLPRDPAICIQGSARVIHSYPRASPCLQSAWFEECAQDTKYLGFEAVREQSHGN